MNDEVVVYLAVLAQRGNICKDGFGHTEQLHSLVYDVGAQVIGQATAILSGFLPSIRLSSKITITGERWIQTPPDVPAGLWTVFP